MKPVDDHYRLILLGLHLQKMKYQYLLQNVMHLVYCKKKEDTNTTKTETLITEYETLHNTVYTFIHREAVEKKAVITVQQSDRIHYQYLRA